MVNIIIFNNQKQQVLSRVPAVFIFWGVRQNSDCDNLVELRTKSNEWMYEDFVGKYSFLCYNEEKIS